VATAIPSNRAEFTDTEIRQALGVAGRVNSASAAEHCRGVTTDSRGDVAGKLFLALCGESFDGHRFVPDVLRRGAFGVVVEREVEQAEGSRVYRVASTLDALGALAKLHRERWNGRVVTIGGSAGKTTTRSAMTAVFEALLPGRVHSTTGNLNNRIGVPMTLLGLEAQHELAVVEVGTNQRGEMAALARVCQADLSVLTCIGLEHSEGLGDLDGIEAEESDLFSSMREGGSCLGLHDDFRVLRVIRSVPEARVWSYGAHAEATHRILGRSAIDASRVQLRILRKLGHQTSELTAITRLHGLPGALASTAAIAAADALLPSVDGELLGRALDRDVGEAGRLTLHERPDRALVINDCYNANPVSMRSSIAVTKEIAEARRSCFHLVMGDMLELGPLSRREHAALVDAVTGASHIVAVGREMLSFVHEAEQRGLAVAHFDDAETAAGHVRDLLSPGDVLLVKGSRSMRLERVVSEVIGGKE
jgi:UDP-N-acetylmuramoyl-tripeptide--D-alanyl-D-alanine ligase